MKNVFVKDSACLAFQPLIDLTPCHYANLTSRTVTYWQKQKDINAWGPAMLLVAPFRFMLNRAGLPIEWKTCPTRFFGNVDCPIYTARSLLYSGFHANAESVLNQVKEKDPEKLVWKALLLTQIQRSKNQSSWSIVDLENCLKNYQKDISNVLKIQVLVTIVIYWVTEGRDPKKAEEWLDKLLISITRNSYFLTHPFDRAMAVFRGQRYYAAHLINLGNRDDYRETIAVALEELDKVREKHSVKTSYSRKFLVDEAKRRMLEFHLLNLWKENAFDEALPFALEAANLDPNCAKALMLAGYTAYKANQMDLASDLLKESITKGVLERAFCRRLLLEFEPSFRPKTTELRAIADSNFFSFKLGIQPGEPIQEPPVYFKDYQVFLKEENTDVNIEKYLKKQSLYKTYLPFWELRKPRNEESLFLAEAPLLAWEAWTQRKSPFFNTLYIQRMPLPDFRKELWNATVGSIQFAQEYESLGTDFDYFLTLSPNNSQLGETIANKAHLSTLELSLLARVIGYLGFVTQAHEISKFDLSKSKWTAEEAYLANTHLFYEFLLKRQQAPEFDEKLTLAMHKMQNTPETLRAKFSFCLLACIFHAPIGNIKKISDWRELAQQVINEILDSSQFSDFEKTMLHSRFYRAFCYLPFLTNDDQQLLFEAKACEKLARALQPKDQFEVILKKDILFATLDTLHRVYNKLGDKERAKHMLLEVLETLAPNDTKILNQLGQLFEDENNPEMAAFCFCQATTFGAPLGRVAAYRAGFIFEKAGNKRAAIDYYFKSLQFWPNGLSPLQGIKRVATKAKDYYLKAWANTMLKNYEQ